MAKSDRRLLDCPNCGEPLIPASGRGRWDDDGNFVEHREGCRCPRCEWVWFDDAEPVRCKCGALVKVAIDDEHAYATEAGDDAEVAHERLQRRRQHEATDVLLHPGGRCTCGGEGRCEWCVLEEASNHDPDWSGVNDG